MSPFALRAAEHPIECLARRRPPSVMHIGDAGEHSVSALGESRTIRFALLVALGCLVWSSGAEAEEGWIEIDDAATLSSADTPRPARLRTHSTSSRRAP